MNMVVDRICTGLYAMRSQKPHSSLSPGIIKVSGLFGDFASKLSVDWSTRVSASDITEEDRRCLMSRRDRDLEVRL